jgi:hypothetical protein
MKIKGPTILLKRKGRMRFTSIPGAMEAFLASITISNMGVDLVKGR